MYSLMDIFSLISQTHVLGKGRVLLKGHFIYKMVVVFFFIEIKSVFFIIIFYLTLLWDQEFAKHVEGNILKMHKN